MTAAMVIETKAYPIFRMQYSFSRDLFIS